MFRFFRSLRQRFLSENRFSKYLIYATGEIILIVFGIVTYTRKAPDTKTENGIKPKKPGAITYLLKGFFLNIANPFVLPNQMFPFLSSRAGIRTS